MSFLIFLSWFKFVLEFVSKNGAGNEIVPTPCYNLIINLVVSFGKTLPSVERDLRHLRYRIRVEVRFLKIL
jgi:hypothetical protein